MKNKLIVVALIALILAGGMVLVSCGGCPGDGKCKVEWGESADFTYCGSKITDTKKLEKAMECKIYKDAISVPKPGDKSECDC